MSEKQFEILDLDFLSMESFPLKWRWTDEQYNKLPLTYLAQIKPLKEEKAQELSKIQKQYLASGSLDDRVIENKEHIRTDPLDTEIIKNWLKRRIRYGKDFIYISWNSNWAVRTTTEVFCNYWDDFCYPASDDIVILPEKIKWIMTYHHEEHLFFGKVREELI